MNKAVPTFDSPLPGWLADTPAVTGARFIYEMLISNRNRRYDLQSRHLVHSVGVPVISIGGIRAGGTGKTPATYFLIDYFHRRGYEVAVLSRGYKRKERAPLVVPPLQQFTWESVGDEPAMLRAAFPDVWLGIGADRVTSARSIAAKMGNRAILLMDDGFQHRRLRRDLDIVCVHESIFSDRMIPQGYLREPVSSLGRAQLHFCITGEDGIDSMRTVATRLGVLFPQSVQLLLINRFSCWVNAASGEERTDLPLENPVALCGIARPDRFFSLLDGLQISCAKKMSFSDHYIFRESDFTSLRKLYSHGFVTTEKDMIRLAAVKNLPAEKLWYCKIRLEEAENDPSGGFSHYIKGSNLNHENI